MKCCTLHFLQVWDFGEKLCFELAPWRATANKWFKTEISTGWSVRGSIPTCQDIKKHTKKQEIPWETSLNQDSHGNPPPLSHAPRFRREHLGFRRIVSSHPDRAQEFKRNWSQIEIPTFWSKKILHLVASSIILSTCKNSIEITYSWSDRKSRNAIKSLPSSTPRSSELLSKITWIDASMDENARRKPKMNKVYCQACVQFHQKERYPFLEQHRTLHNGQHHASRFASGTLRLGQITKLALQNKD